jgi:hypothetical protein
MGSDPIISQSMFSESMKPPVIGGDRLHGLEIRVESGPSELLQRHQAPAEDRVFLGGEFEGRAEDIYQ